MRTRLFVRFSSVVFVTTILSTLILSVDAQANKKCKAAKTIGDCESYCDTDRSYKKCEKRVSEPATTVVESVVCKRDGKTYKGDGAKAHKGHKPCTSKQKLVGHKCVAKEPVVKPPPVDDSPPPKVVIREKTPPETRTVVIREQAPKPKPKRRLRRGEKLKFDPTTQDEQHPDDYLGCPIDTTFEVPYSEHSVCRCLTDLRFIYTRRPEAEHDLPNEANQCPDKTPVEELRAELDTVKGEKDQLAAQLDLTKPDSKISKLTANVKKAQKAAEDAQETAEWAWWIALIAALITIYEFFFGPANRFKKLREFLAKGKKSDL